MKKLKLLIKYFFNKKKILSIKDFNDRIKEIANGEHYVVRIEYMVLNKDNGEYLFSAYIGGKTWYMGCKSIDEVCEKMINFNENKSTEQNIEDIIIQVDNL